MHTECDYCIHLLLDDLDVLDRNVSTVRRQLADVSVGVAAFNRLAQYNNTVTELRVCVHSLCRLLCCVVQCSNRAQGLCTLSVLFAVLCSPV